MPPGILRFGGMPPTSPPGLGPPEFICMPMLPMFMFPGEGPDRPAIFIRCSWRARALCMISDGRLDALGVGLLAVFKSPVTLEVELIWLDFCGSEAVLNDGTRRGSSAGEELGCASELELGGSRGVLAPESAPSEPGEVGLLTSYSSAGVVGSRLS